MLDTAPIPALALGLLAAVIYMTANGINRLQPDVVGVFICITLIAWSGISLVMRYLRRSR